MKIVPKGTSESISISDDSVSENTADDTNALLPEINFMLEYDNAMLEYDHEITQAMNFIDNL
jgi:hypothetical protein